MKITDTIQARIITILEDYYEHDADLSAECSLELVKLVEEECIKAFDKGLDTASQ